MSDKEHSFPLIELSLPRRLGQKIPVWLKEQKVLFEAVCVALSLHVLALPFLWFIGWALPWPKSPVIVTVIEINLEN